MPGARGETARMPEPSRRRARIRTCVPFVLVLAVAFGCGSVDPGGSGTAAIELPAHAAPDPQLVPLELLVGKWVTVNPNGTVNEEHWMAPRGSVMLGTFRQVRLDGRCAFVELSQIAVEDGAVVLRLRHLHGKLEVPEGREDTSLFRLKEIGARRVEFAGTGDAEGVTSVVYERVGDDELVQAIGFDPAKSQEKPFTSRYRRDRT